MKSGILTEEQKALYANIEGNADFLRRKFAAQIASLTAEKKEGILERCESLGFTIDLESGHLRYAPNFQPLSLPYDICYIRHGKTEGNTEPRIFQGQVDYEENALNHVGLKQAEDAAEKMAQQVEAGWKPDLIVFSPLSRARDTGMSFASRYPDIPTTTLDETAEMAFGDWDNRKVIDIPSDSVAHLFYLDQNVLVVADKPHLIGPGARNGLTSGTEIPGECFVDVLERFSKALPAVAQLEPLTHIIPKRRPKVLFYGHSMAGAAVTILLGLGKTTSEGHLAFDGKYIMPNATPAFLEPKKP